MSPYRVSGLRKPRISSIRLANTMKTVTSQEELSPNLLSFQDTDPQVGVTTDAKNVQTI
jgi:hypothetical protein